MPHGVRSARADQYPHNRPVPGPPAPFGLRGPAMVAVGWPRPDTAATDTALLTRGAKTDHEAERLIIEAAVAADSHQRPARGLSRSAGTAALVNHALRSEDPRAVTLLRPPMRAQREPPEPEP